MTSRPLYERALVCTLVAACCGLIPAFGANPAPSQLFYVPVPENDQLAAYSAINSAAVDPLNIFVTFSAASDKTVIYYDHWEDGYEQDITNPTQATTQIFGDGNQANGYPPGNAADLISAGTVFSLRNYVTSSQGSTVIKFDSRDKIASFKPISLTKTSFPASTNSLLAGCVEVFERGLWGTEYRVPVGADMPTTTATATLTHDADMFAYTSISVMAGAGGANVQIDANNDGVFEQNPVLVEGGSITLSGVSAGARVLSDKPVQVVMFTGRPGSNYQSRDTSLLPTYRWSSRYYAPVSTSATYGTVVFLYNPGTSAITVSYDHRSSTSAYTTGTVSVPAGGNARVTLSPASGTTHYGAYRFYTTGTTPPIFYAFCAVDAASANTGDNQAFDGGFTLVGQPSLSTQVLLSLGIGRDPNSTTSPNENGNPVWITTAGNGHTAETVYVDYNGDNAGALADANGNRYDTSYSLRELQQQKIFDPDGDQSGMLVYVLNPNVKIAAAWAQDPAVASASQPGLDVSTLIPPLREGDGSKGSTIAVDTDGDGRKSAGDTLEYDIRTVNTARTGIVGPFTVKDNLPVDLIYVRGSAKYRYSVGGAWQAWVTIPDDGSGTAFPLDVAGYNIPGTLGVGQQIQVVFRAVIKSYADLTPGLKEIVNTGNIVMTPLGVTLDIGSSDPLYGSIGDRIWNDADGDGVQDVGETGLNNVRVYLDSNNNGLRDSTEPTVLTSGDGAYVFNGLLAGNQVVRVDPSTVAALNPGYGATYDLDGIATAYAATVTLASAQDRVDADFGFRVGASVGDRVWMDRDGDGVQEAGEPGINGVRVYVDTNNNNTCDSGEPFMLTSGDGAYSIGNLVPGSHAVRVDTATLPAGAAQTSDLNGGLDHEAAVSLISAEHRGDLDFGYRGTLSIGDLVWEDSNGNGSVTTSSTNYSVNNGRVDINGDGNENDSDDGFIGSMRIINGYVDIDNDTQLDNDDDGTFLGVAMVNGGFDMNGSGGISTSGNNDDGTVTYTVNEAGIASVRVYIDINGDGIYNSTEPSTLTNAGGAYTIGNLLNGTYTLRVDTTTLPTSYVQTYDLTSPSTDHSATVVLSGSSRTDADFGYRNDASIGDLVWNDRDADGVVDAGEPGIEGVIVYIDANSNGIFDQATERYAITNFNGYYLIDNLPAGSYLVRIDISSLPQGSTQTHDFDGTGSAHRATRTLATSEDAVNVDFGYRATASVGDFVWNDVDADGIQDAGETGISGVRVYLDINGNGIFESATEPAATTDSAGAYTLRNLVPGTYTGRVDISTLSSTFVQTYDPAGDVDNAATFSLSAAQARADIDFGYTTRVTIGDFVWDDTNANGQQNSGETGIPGVTVTAFNAANDTIAATATTNAAGAYSFTLMPGAYYVVFDKPAGYNATLADNGADATDSDANVTTGRTPDVTLTGGQSNVALDAGFYQPSVIGDFVWNDANANGQQDVGETGLNGISVTLYRPGFGPDGIAGNSDDATAVASTTTGAGGAYSFTSLRPGIYQVNFGTFAGYNRTFADQGADATDSDAGTATGTTGNVILAANTSNTTIDAGYYQPGSISGTVFADTDNNDSGDLPISNVTLTLKDASGNDIDSDPNTSGTQPTTTTTNASGVYIFTNLMPRTYRVVQTQPSGYLSVMDIDGLNNNTIGDQTPVVVTAGQAVTGRNFVEEQPGTVAGHLYIDTNGNGTQDSGEPDLAGVDVLVTQSNGATQTVPSDSNGNWTAIVPPGITTADVQESDSQYPTGYTQTQGTDPTTSYAIAGTPVNGGTDGYFLPGSITGSVLADTDNDNLGDSPIGSVILTLVNSSGSPIDGDPNTSGVQPVTTTTAINGSFTFGNLPPGTYGVVEGQPPGYHSVSDMDGGNPDEIRPITVTAGNPNSGNDFIEEYPGSLSGTVFADSDGDADGDTSLAGVVIRLLDSAGSPVLDGLGAPVTTTTQADGTYAFGGLTPGSYRVHQDQPSNYNSVSDTDGANNNHIGDETPLVVIAGNNTGGNDFIEIELGVISGYVLLDTDNNGSGDAPLSGVVLHLLDGSGNPVLDGLGAPLQVASGAGGFYSFTAVPVGSYRVSQNQPATYGSVSDVDGANNNIIGDETPVAMTPGLIVTNRNFVEIAFGSIAGTVREDTDNNGSGDAPLAGVTLTLLDSTGNPVDGDPVITGVQPVTRVTGVDGAYHFAELFPGSYQISETQPSGYGSVSDVDAGNPDIIGATTAIAVAPGQQVTGRDFVEIRLGSISGYVYVGSAPLAGVTLTLLDEDGNPVDGDPGEPGVQPVTTVTDSGGHYVFAGIMPGDYQVAQIQPLAYDSFGDLDGGDINIIGDVTRISVLPGQENADNDFSETLGTCPNDWAQWKIQHPAQLADGNPDSDNYDNLNEFAFAMPADNGSGSPWLGDTAWTIRPSELAPGTLEGVFVRPKGATQDVTYTLEYVASLDAPIIWASLEITPSVITTADNGDCTETVTIHDLEGLTGLEDGAGFVRIRADLDEDGDTTTDHTSRVEVEGWKETGMELCCRTYGHPFLRETSFTGTVGTVSSQDISFTASGGGGLDLSMLLAPGAGYYIEVVSGDNEGHRFDVVSATANSLTLANDADLHAATAPYNTLTGELPATLAGDRIVLHRHWTLGEIFPVDGFGATANRNTADQIQAFADGQWSIYWLYDDGGSDRHWVKTGDGTYADRGSTVLPPGYGVFFNNRTAVTSILAYGEVRENDFTRPLDRGSNLVSSGYPLDQSPVGATGREMTLAQGVFGSRDAATADSIFVWNGDANAGASGYTTYFLSHNPARTVPTKWARIGDPSLSPRDLEKFMHGNRSAFISSKNGADGYTVPCPWTP